MGTRFSAIDIGSNAIRMIVGETTGETKSAGPFQVLKKFRAPVRLGRDVFTTGHVSEQTLQEAKDAFQEFAGINKKFKVAHCRAVATSALREAKNQTHVVQSLLQSSQIHVEVIDGLKEAELIFLAVQQEINLSQRQALLLDIGGGSVEVTLCRDEKMQATQSFPLGTVRLLETLRKRDLAEKHLNVVIGELVGPMVSYLEKNAGGTQFHFGVGTGGNLEAMAKLKVQLLRKTPNTFISLGELAELTEILQSYSVKERIQTLELRADRADVIVPAMMVVKLILRQAGIEKILVPGVGLRDGLLRQALLRSRN